MGSRHTLLILLFIGILFQTGTGMLSGIEEQWIAPVNDNKVNSSIPDVFVEYEDCYDYGYDYVDLAHVIRVDVNNKILKNIRYWQHTIESDGVFNTNESGKNIEEYKIVKVVKNDDVYKFYLRDKIFTYDTVSKKAEFNYVEFLPLEAIKNQNLVFINCNIYLDNDLDLPFNGRTVNMVKDVWQYYCDMNMEETIIFLFCWRYVNDQIELFIRFVDLEQGAVRKTYRVKEINSDNNESIVFVLDDDERLTITADEENNFSITGPWIKGSFFGCI